MKRSRGRDRPQPPPPPPVARREDGAQRAAELPQPLAPRRRAPPGRQRLEERTGPPGPEVPEQVGRAVIWKGKPGEGEPEWERGGGGLAPAGRLELGR